MIAARASSTAPAHAWSSLAVGVGTPARVVPVTRIILPHTPIGRRVRVTATGATTASRWVGRNVGTARQLGGRGNVGMMRLLDLHAASCAGDTLITIGLAGAMFFGVA